MKLKGKRKFLSFVCFCSAVCVLAFIHARLGIDASVVKTFTGSITAVSAGYLGVQGYLDNGEKS